MGRKSHQAIILFLCCWLQACVKDKPQPAAGDPPHGSNKVFVVCEGSLGNGDGTLYLYDRDRKTVSGDLYKAANGLPLGDVFQSMTRIGDKLFLCVNNSDKIAVTDTVNYKVVATIHIPKPRYALQVSASRAFVSTLYSNKVYVIDVVNYAVVDSITMPAQNPEGMCLVNGEAWICTWDTACNSVYRINTATNKITQTIKINGYAPQEAIADKAGMVWVLAGNKTKGKTATLTRIDPLTGELLHTYTFPGEADVLKPAMNKTKDSLYFIEVNYYGSTANNGIYRMGILDADLPSQPFIAGTAYQYFWGLGIDPVTNNIFVGDPKGFTQKGTIQIYRPDGSTVDSFSVGLGPGHFYFE